MVWITKLSILIDNSLVSIHLEPMLLTLSSLLIGAQAFWFGVSGENEGVSVTGQEAWGFSLFSPMFCPFLAYSKGT